LTKISKCILYFEPRGSGQLIVLSHLVTLLENDT